MNAIQGRAIEAAVRFCERRGYEILSVNWESPAGAVAHIVADDEGTVCFIDVTVADHAVGGFASDHIARGDWEVLAASWLAENVATGDMPVRFDRCSLLVIGEDRALLRYHINALSEG